MNYTIHWMEEAITGLLETAVTSGNAAAILGAIDDVNRRLAEDPEDPAAKAYEGLWGLSVGRLRIMYEIYHDRHVVEIVSARLLKT